MSSIVERLRELVVIRPNDRSTTRYEPYVTMTETMRDQLAALIEGMENVIEAAKPFADERLSTEPIISDLLYRSPSDQLREQAQQMEKRDARIRALRSAMSAALKDAEK